MPLLKITVPPVRPKRTSLVSRGVSVDRSAATAENAMPPWLPGSVPLSTFCVPGKIGLAVPTFTPSGRRMLVW